MVGGPSTGVAQEADADAAALAKAAQNPLASVISTPIQWNSNFGMGPEDRTQNVILFQPVLPFSLGSKLTLITRHILPIINQPALDGDGPAFGPIPMPPGRPPEEFDRATGLGDYSGTFWLSPAGSGDLTWGLGATLLVPTATKPAFGADKWGAGPSGVLVWMPGSWVTAERRPMDRADRRRWRTDLQDRLVAQRCPNPGVRLLSQARERSRLEPADSVEVDVLQVSWPAG